MKDPKSASARNGGLPLFDSANSVIVEAEGEEDTTIRPLRPSLRKALGLEPAPPVPPAASGDPALPGSD